MKNHHLQRLIRLADKLEGVGPYADVGPVPTRKFDLDWFFNASRGSGEEIRRRDFNPRQCSTTACAVGWASVDPWFTKRLPLSGYLLSGTENIRMGAWSARLFGLLDDRDWRYLFSANSYPASRNPTPRDVARRIRSFVKRRAAELGFQT